MSDLAAAQREARRRKITQNAQARMNRLLGRPDLTDSNHQDISNSAPQPESTTSPSREEEDQPTSQSQPQSILETPSPSPTISKSQPQQKPETPSPAQPKSELQPTLETPSPAQSSPYNLRRRPRRSESPAAPSSSERTATQSVPTLKHTATVEEKEKAPAEEKNKHLPTLGTEDFKGNHNEIERPLTSAQTETSAAQDAKSHTQDPSRLENQSHTTFDAKAVELLRIVSCVMTSFICRSVLKFGFGLFMVESIFLPFFAMEGFFVYIMETYMKDVSPVQTQGTLVSAALMLCGIKPEVMGIYHKIMSHVAMVTNDFSMFFFSFIIWNAMMT